MWKWTVSKFAGFDPKTSKEIQFNIDHKIDVCKMKEILPEFKKDIYLFSFKEFMEWIDDA